MIFIPGAFTVTPNISDRGVKMIAAFEALILHLYYDVAGILTVCVGHVVRAGENWSSVTREMCETTLGRDVGRFVACFLRNVRVPFSQPILDACVSLCFNIGEHAFETSSVLRFLNLGNYLAAAKAFELWCNAQVKQKDGSFLKKPVLLGRRKSEEDVFVTGISEVTMGTIEPERSIEDILAAAPLFNLQTTLHDGPAGIELERYDNDFTADDGRIVAIPPEMEEAIA